MYLQQRMEPMSYRLQSHTTPIGHAVYTSPKTTVSENQ